MAKLPQGPAALPLKPGEVVAGRYRIVSVLLAPGTAPLGATYTALDLVVGAAAPAGTPPSAPALGHVTLRVLADHGSAPGTYSLSEDDLTRFEQQAARLISVRHPAVAKTHELALQAEVGVVLARESVETEGQTLRDVLAVRGGPLPEAEAIELCAQIGEALEVVHQHGACHLGLSPSCVFVYPDGAGVRIKVADFGLLPPAWAARVGEAGYLAPEQVDGQLDGQSCDRRTDQFALAVILYEMLAGQPAFIAAAEEDRQIILSRVRNEDPLPLSQSRAVEQALARALSRSRAVRFSSVRDFIRALGADVSRWPVGHTLLGPTGPPNRGRSPRVFLPMAAGAVFSLLGLGGVVALRQLTRTPLSAPMRGGAVRAVPGDLSAASGPAVPPDAAATPPGERPAAPGPAADLSPSADAGAGDDARAGHSGGTPDLRRSEPRGPTEGPRPPKPTLPVPTGPGKGIPSGPDDPVPPVAPPQGPGPAAALPLAFLGPEVGALTGEQREQLTSCVKMISPRLPLHVELQKINDVLYVDPNHTSPQFSGSQDFRDCLKLRVKGKIVPKVLTIIRMSKGKAAP